MIDSHHQEDPSLGPLASRRALMSIEISELAMIRQMICYTCFRGLDSLGTPVFWFKCLFISMLEK